MGPKPREPHPPALPVTLRGIWAFCLGGQFGSLHRVLPHPGFTQPLGSNPQQALKPTTTSEFQFPTPKWENLMGTAWMGPSLVQSVGQGRVGGAQSRSATLWGQACCKQAWDS